MDAYLPLLEQIIPLLAAALVVLIMSGVKRLVPSIPSRFIPVLLPVASGLLTALGTLVGVEVAPDALANIDTASATIEAILVGSAAVGLHQIKQQARKAKGDPS